MLGLDTSFLIDFFAEDEGAKKLWESEEAVCLCEPVVFEFLCGNLTKREEEIFLQFASQITTLPMDRKVAIKSAQLYRQEKRKGKTLGAMDALVGGTYAANQVTRIATRNTKHFENLEKIQTVDY